MNCQFASSYVYNSSSARYLLISHARPRFNVAASSCSVPCSRGTRSSHPTLAFSPWIRLAAHPGSLSRRPVRCIHQLGLVIVAVLRGLELSPSRNLSRNFSRNGLLQLELLPVELRDVGPLEGLVRGVDLVGEAVLVGGGAVVVDDGVEPAALFRPEPLDEAADELLSVGLGEGKGIRGRGGGRGDALLREGGRHPGNVFRRCPPLQPLSVGHLEERFASEDRTVHKTRHAFCVLPPFALQPRRPVGLEVESPF